MSAQPLYRIGLDARMVRHTGIGTYLRGILGGFQRCGDLKKRDMALFGPPDLRETFPEAQQESFDAPIYSPREQLLYPKLLARCRLWHAPHYNIPLLHGRTKLVVTVHDLIHWIFRREYFSTMQAVYARLMFSRTVQSAAHIICVSENTREDLIRHFRAPREKLSVILEAVDPGFAAPDRTEDVRNVLQKHRLNGPYFLYVGSLKPHKNVLALIRAFRNLKARKKIEARLVLAGRKDRRYDEAHRELGELVSDADIVHLDRIENGELPSLYAGALALVHPSRYEGFGLTLLEAMSCGTPVAALRASSIPEVTGDAALLLEPGSDAALEEALVRLERDTALRQDLGLRGRSRVLDFSWDRAAGQTMEIYERVLAQP